MALRAITLFPTHERDSVHRRLQVGAAPGLGQRLVGRHRLPGQALEAFDHRDLNEVVDVAPTSENLARLLYEWCAVNLRLPAGVTVAAVQIRETASTFAEYSPVRP